MTTAGPVVVGVDIRCRHCKNNSRIRIATADAARPRIYCPTCRKFGYANLLYEWLVST